MTTAEVTLLERAKQSLTADPDFTMHSWQHCLANHICQAAGHNIYGEYLADTVIHVKDRALELIPSAHPHFFSCDVLGTDKELVCRRVDQLIAESYVSEPEMELVGV